MADTMELERWLTPEAWRAIAERLGLSPRERDVVKGVIDDRTELGIGQALAISPHTVHTYLERIYHKVGVNSRTELVSRVWRCYLCLAASPGADVPPICPQRERGVCQFSG